MFEKPPRTNASVDIDGTHRASSQGSHGVEIDQLTTGQMTAPMTDRRPILDTNMSV